MAASKNILFWTPRGELIRNQRRIPVTSISELIEYVLLPFNSDVKKPRALNSFLEGLAELGINKKWIKNTIALSDILDEEEMQTHQESTDTFDSQDSTINSEHEEDSEEESEQVSDIESDEVSEDDGEEDDGDSEEENEEPRKSEKRRCDFGNHTDIDVKRTVECPKCHWLDALMNACPQFNMTISCPICKHRFRLNYDTAKSKFERCNECKTLTHYSQDGKVVYDLF